MPAPAGFEAARPLQRCMGRWRVSPYDLDGAADLVRRIAAFAENERVPTEPRQCLQAVVDRYRAHVLARDRVRNWLKAADRHVRNLDRLARALDWHPRDLRS